MPNVTKFLSVAHPGSVPQPLYGTGAHVNPQVAPTPVHVPAAPVHVGAAPSVHPVVTPASNNFARAAIEAPLPHATSLPGLSDRPLGNHDGLSAGPIARSLSADHLSGLESNPGLTPRPLFTDGPGAGNSFHSVSSGASGQFSFPDATLPAQPTPAGGSSLGAKAGYAALGLGVAGAVGIGTGLLLDSLLGHDNAPEARQPDPIYPEWPNEGGWA